VATGGHEAPRRPEARKRNWAYLTGDGERAYGRADSGRRREFHYVAGNSIF